MTRLELEQKLENTFVGNVVGYTNIYGKLFTGVMQSLAAEPKGGLYIIIFVINNRRHECDMDHFVENITIYGDPTRNRTGRTGF